MRASRALRTNGLRLMTVNPWITRDPATGKCTLRWNRDPNASGYFLETQSGSALAGAGKTSSNLGVHDSITASVTPLYADPKFTETASYPPVPVPPASGQPWAWDATKAVLLPNSAALVADYLAHGFGNGASFSCDVAVSETGRPGDPAQATYNVTGSKVTNYDIAVYAQPGVRAGASSDRHLVLRDHLRGKEHDFWQASPAGTSIGSGGGGSFPLDAPQEPIGKWSNAARFPLARTAITADEVKAGRITHALEFSAVASWIGGPSVYPADGTSSGPGHGLPFGQWLRLDPAADISGLTGLDRIIAQALKEFGMLLRDGGSELDMSGVDYVNQGGNAAVWGDAGVTLSGSPYPWHRGLGGIPWAKLQALAPPVKQ